MTLQTVTLARPSILPQSADCDCCAEHLAAALRACAGVAVARLDGAQLVLEVEPGLAGAGAAERLALAEGQRIAARYDHPVFAVEGMDCADCARTFERAVERLAGVHYASVNFAAARLRLEYDREMTSVEAVRALAQRLGYRLQAPDALAAAPALVGETCAPGACDCAHDDADHDGHAHDHAQAPAAEDRARRMLPGLRAFVQQRPRDVLTLASGALIAVAWLGGLLGMPAGVSAGLYVAATLAGGVLVARAGWAALIATRSFDINLLMTIAALGALAIGEYAEGATVVFLFALGNALEGYTMDRARRSIRQLMQLAPATALVLRPSARPADAQDHQHPTPGSQAELRGSFDEVRVPIGQVRVGETIAIRPGDRVPLDAVVLAGTSAVNQAPITGESMPVEKSAGAELYAGSINGTGALEARVTRVANDSTLARIIHLVEEAQSQKSRAQRFVDVFARRYTPAVIVLAVLVALLPPLLAGGAWALWFYRALVLLVIACPCALVISTPVSIVSAISAAARAGVLFKGGASLEAAGRLRAIAFDKTGTLTAGKPVVTDVDPIEGGSLRLAERRDQSTVYNLQSAMLSLAAAVERRSTHPLARAIVAAAEARGLAIPAASGHQMSGGRGASALVEGRAALVGNRALFGGQLIPAELDARYAELERSGRTAMLVCYDGAFLGVLAAADQARPESRAAVAALRRQGIAHIGMLTGDAAAVAARVADEVVVDEARAGLLPEQKLAAIGELAARYGSVAMVGDGVNDAPALARATVGIAMGAAGSDAALETADVTLMSDDLGKLPFAIGLSRAARRVIMQNVVFALAVKAVFLAATLLGAATLWMAVFADTGAALIVIANGMRLLRYRPDSTQ